MNILTRALPRFGPGLVGGLLAALTLLWGLAHPALAQAQAQQAQPVGKLIMSIGTVTLVHEGKESPAPRDTLVQAGDTVRTGASSNAQLRLNDGAIIALRPASEFKINAFSYNGKADGSERASLSLLKGGVRAVTGVIGRGNHDNLKVDAVVATIGIRGTGFNLVLCGAECQAGSREAKAGLYAGVFEGRIAVANQGGTAVDLGVNQFLHVADVKTQPVRLVAPPVFLKDSLVGQQTKTPEQKAAAPAAVPSTVSEQATQAAEKAPVEVVSVPVTQVATVAAAPSPPPAVVIVPPPAKFYDTTGLGDTQALATTNPANTFRSFQSAEFNPSGTDRRADNQVLEGNSGTTLSFTQYDTYKLQTATKNSVDAYAIRGSYTATQKEGGADGGVVAWGRWAGGTALIGSYGTVTYADNQGFHWIAGTRLYNVPTAIQNQSFAFNLLGATLPTEAISGAQLGWRVYGGNINANFGTANVSLSGLLNLYLARADGGTGAFNMNFSGTSASNSIAYTNVTGSVVRTQGTVPVCAASCGAAGVVAFYGSQASHAGLTYEFNTGPSYVQGAAVFKR